MTPEIVNFETVLRIYLAASPDRQREALRSWLAALNPESEQLEAPLLSLKNVGRSVGKDPTWLWKLKIREHCGIRLAGSYRYRKSDVLAYLQSQECLARIAELHRIRKEREAAKDKDAS